MIQIIIGAAGGDDFVRMMVMRAPLAAADGLTAPAPRKTDGEVFYCRSWRVFRLDRVQDNN